MTYLSSRELAQEWDVSEAHISKLCREGKLPGAQKDGRNWQIPDGVRRPADGRSSQKQHALTGGARLLPVGISSYREVVQNYYYVDKTLLLRDLLNDGPGIYLFTRPRRFGKSLNLDMIRTFFEQTETDTSDLFRDKNIWRCGAKYREYQGAYPVIFLSFRNGKRNRQEDMILYLKRTLGNEYLRHPELADSETCTSLDRTYYHNMVTGDLSDGELMDALDVLTRMLHMHHGVKPVILIDEYDVPIQQSWFSGFYDDCVNFMRNLFAGGLKDNPHVSYGILTGILRIAKESMFSGLNNLQVNSILDSAYSEYFGFTTEEVEELAEYYGATDRLDEIHEWYDGYRFGPTDIYNPWSVSNYFRENYVPKAYWVYTTSNDLVGDILPFSSPADYRKLKQLLNGKTVLSVIDTDVVFPALRSNSSMIYSFLLLGGYLKALDSKMSTDGNAMCHVAIPNKEVLTVFRKEVLDRMDKAHVIPRDMSYGIEEALFAGDSEGLAYLLEELLMESASFFDTAHEDFYHGFILGLCAILRDQYRVTSNRESGKGRYDIQLEPRSDEWPGILIELKASGKSSPEDLSALAEKALQQIRENQYDTEMVRRGLTQIYEYGVAFHGKQVAVATSLPNL
ncbi:MAG: AAA family ATPase [Clostridia bacterium]|nr:AAA family ATPase [Clostridia bacterium]